MLKLDLQLFGGRGSSNPQGGGKKYGGQYGTITQSALDKLISFGATRWQKNGQDRLYIGDAGDKIIGLETVKYGSGNIRSAELNGEPISNSLARSIQSIYKDAYINLMTGGIVGLKDSPYKENFLSGMSKYRKKG